MNLSNADLAVLASEHRRQRDRDLVARAALEMRQSARNIGVLIEVRPEIFGMVRNAQERYPRTFLPKLRGFAARLWREQRAM